MAAAVEATADVSDPRVMFAGVSDWSADHWVYALAENYGTKYPKQSVLWTTVNKKLRDADMPSIIQRREIQMIEEGSEFHPEKHLETPKSAKPVKKHGSADLMIGVTAIMKKGSIREKIANFFFQTLN